MNILGTLFKPYVTDQINIRQSSIGREKRSLSDLQYLNSKTPWIRLVSSIDVTNESPTLNGGITMDNSNTVLKRLSKLGINPNLLVGSNLAKNLTLFGGVLNNNDFKLKFGINNTNNIFQNAYGFGGVQEKGIVPMPGIRNVQVQYYNNGALSKTLIDIKCYNRNQLMLLDVLYLRVGYTLLLEFGHSLYLNNSGELITNQDFNTKPYNLILNPNSNNQFDMWDSIEEERASRDGNYDGVFGKVTNFSWNFNPDGSYDVQIHLTSVGEIIESLKLNLPPKLEDKSTLQSNCYTSIFHQLITNIEQDQFFFGFETDFNVRDYSISNFSLPNTNFKEKIDLEIKNGVLTIPYPKLNGPSPHLETKLTYINFGVLIALIQHYILPYNNDCPLISFDMDFQNLHKDKNYIFKFPGQFSSDPTKCIVPWENTCNIFEGYLGSLFDDILNLDINELLNKNPNHFKGTYLRRLSQIYINTQYIVDTIDGINKDEEGNIKVLEFLQQIINGVTQCLGGVNSLQLVEYQNKIKFIENIPQRFDNPEEEDLTNGKLATINLFGVKEGLGSFVKSISLNSQLSNEFSYLASISAQVNSNQLGVNPMGFSNYSLGLKDRIIEKKQLNKKVSTTSFNNPLRDIEDMFEKDINNNKTSLFKIIYQDFNLNNDNLKSLFNINLEYSKAIVGELNVANQIASSAFIPFQLSFKLDGISGISLYQKFNMDQKVLPLHYETNDIDNQINSINHTINKEGWDTEIETISVPNYTKLAPIGESQYMEQLQQIDQQLSCGEPYINPTLPPNNSVSLIQDGLLINQARDRVMDTYGPTGSMCARYVYNIADNYVNLRNGNPLHEGPILQAGGNAKQRSYWNSLQNLGYSTYLMAENIDTVDEIQDVINNITYDIGDVIVYWANVGDPNHNIIKYGHTQIYLGNGRWESSKDYNYGGHTFIYKTAGVNFNCWNLYLHRLKPWLGPTIS